MLFFLLFIKEKLTSYFIGSVFTVYECLWMVDEANVCQMAKSSGVIEKKEQIIEKI